MTYGRTLRYATSCEDDSMLQHQRSTTSTSMAMVELIPHVIPKAASPNNKCAATTVRLLALVTIMMEQQHGRERNNITITPSTVDTIQNPEDDDNDPTIFY
uniref:Uncharacterized protein n=1 Tax=Grammatophora oceanica TaxID=210454 RepID=A0A7S1UR36_9STRA